MITASPSSAQKERENSRLGPVGLRFRSILLATDYSPASATAVKLAARLAKEFHSRLYVLHAVEPDLYAANFTLRTGAKAKQHQNGCEASVVQSVS